MEDVQFVISSMYKVAISKEQVPFEGTMVRGLVERYGENGEAAKIYTKKDIDDDSKRFATIKELCHIMIDEKDDWSPDGAETIDNLLTEYSVDNQDFAKSQSQSEIFAEISAIELMYPYNVRLSDSVLLKKKSLTIAKIANVHKIPPEIVERSLSRWYQKMAKTIWDQVGFE